MLLHRLRLADWIRSYSRQDFRGDLIAGIAVGVMIIPQAMAYAILLGVPPIHGLYASVVPLLVYPIMGTSRHLAIGVIAIDMLVAGAGLLLIAEPGSAEFVSLAILLALMVGLIQFGMGVLRLGFVVHLMSRPVVAGFTSAAALVICFSQLGNLLGIDLPHSQYLVDLFAATVREIPDIHLVSAAVGVGSILFLWGLRAWRPVMPAPIALVVVATLVATIFGLEGHGVAVVGEVPRGFPVLTIPQIDGRSLRALLPTAMTLSLIQIMTVITLGKVFAARHRYRISPNRELAALGLANLAGSLFRGLPVSGSFSRTALNEQVGARTPAANAVAGLVVLITLLFFTPLLRNLPYPALAAIIIYAAVVLVDFREVRLLIHLKRIDGGIALFTFVATLVAGILEGILLGVAASVAGILYRLSRPNFAVLGHLPGTQSFADLKRHPEARPLRGILMVRVDASLSFANAEFFRDMILQRTSAAARAPRVVIIEASSINDVDTTAIEMLIELTATLRRRDVDLYFGGTKSAVMDVMNRARLTQLVGHDHFFVSAHEAVRQVLTDWGRSAEYLEATEENVDVSGTADP